MSALDPGDFAHDDELRHMAGDEGPAPSGGPADTAARVEAARELLRPLVANGWRSGFCSPGEGDPCGECAGCAARVIENVYAGLLDAPSRPEDDLRTRVEAVLPIRVTSEPHNALHSAFDAGWRALAEEVREALDAPSRPPEADTAARVEAIETHNGARVTAANLRWAATHEAQARSWIFDVLTGMADILDAPSRPTPVDLVIAGCGHYCSVCAGRARVAATDDETPRCWRGECSRGCYYPETCSEKRADVGARDTTEGSDDA